MKYRIPLAVSAPAIPLFVVALQPRIFPASPFGWWVTLFSMGVLGVIVVKSSLDGRLALLTRGEAIGRLMLPLLAACAIVPLGSEVMIDAARRIGLLKGTNVAYLHVVVVTVILMVITIEVAGSMQKLESLRLQSEASLRLHIQRMPVAYITTTPDLKVTSWSPAAQRIFGWSESEIMGRSAAILLPEDANDTALKAAWRQILSGQMPLDRIERNTTKDGRIILCRWRGTPVLDAAGKVTAVIGMAEDVTGEQQSQIALLRSEQRYRELVDSLPHFVFSVDADDRYLAVNSAVCRHFRLPESEIIGRRPEEVGLPIEIARARKEQKALTRKTGAMQTGDSAFEIDGRMRRYRTITSPMRDQEGAIIGVTGITMDVTEQREAETGRQILLQAIEQLDEVIFTTDREGLINYVNPAFEKVYGYTREEAVGQTPRILKSGEMSLEFYQHLWSELLAGRSIRTEYKNRRKDGVVIDVAASASPLVDSDGRVSGFVAVQRDVTERNRAAEEHHRLDERLHRLAKMEALGTLAGGMAHDFNNILSIILTHSTLLERQAGDDARVTRGVATIKQAVQRGASLSRQILTFARRTEIKSERFNVSTVIREIASMISETFPRTVHVTLDLDPHLPLISGDSGQLHQALLNLCVNSRDAMPEGGELRIESHVSSAASMRSRFADARDSDYICIAIADNGCGMDEETRRRIFEPFFTTKSKGKGTGLGLAIVYGVVKGHQGVIDVESQPGRGTTLRLFFPIESTPVNVSSAAKPDVENGSETLLLIDDEPAFLEALADDLRLCGYEVFVASDGDEAIETCGRIPPPSAVLMDLGMPRTSPVALVNRLREIVPGVPVIAMTGYIDADVHTTVISAGVTRILQKPFEVTDLKRSLREVIV